MNLNITTQWEHSHIQPDGRTHLVVTISAEGDEAAASNPYLDIRMPEGTRIRYIGDLLNDGFGTTTGIDLPDIESGQRVQLVFRVKTRNIQGDTIVPDIHLHWLDRESDTLTEIDQTGSALPISDEGAPERDADVAEIVAAARSARRTRRTNHSNHPKENHFMRTRRHYRHSNHTGRHHFEGKGHLHRTIEQVIERMEAMERRIRRMERHAAMPVEQTSEHREITRTRRSADSCRSHSRRHRHVHEHGRRMGRMANQAWRDRQLDA